MHGQPHVRLPHTHNLESSVYIEGKEDLCNTDLPSCKAPVIQSLEFLQQNQILTAHYSDGDYLGDSYDTNVINEATYIFLMHKGLCQLLQLMIFLWNPYICTCNITVVTLQRMKSKTKCLKLRSENNNIV